MCLNMMRRIIDELFGKFTIKLTPKKFNKKMNNLRTSVWTSPTFDPHLDHMSHHWYICDATGVSLKQRFQKNSLKFWTIRENIFPKEQARHRFPSNFLKWNCQTYGRHFHCSPLPFLFILSQKEFLTVSMYYHSNF